jgi:hypothetical protein
VFKGTANEVALQESVNTRRGVERCLRFAFEFARKRVKDKKLNLCGKTNVLTYAFDLWERAFHEIGQKDFPDIKREYAHVDATTMWFVKNPEWFDVIVTDNMFGDIITDLGAMLQGGMGIAAGGNINPQGTSMFEPIGAARRNIPAKASSIPWRPFAPAKCCWSSWVKRLQPKPSRTPSSRSPAKRLKASLRAKWATTLPRSAIWSQRLFREHHFQAGPRPRRRQ